MNNTLSQLCTEFEKMEKLIAFQKQVISDFQQPTAHVCPCGFLPVVAPERPKIKLADLTWYEIALYAQSGVADKMFALGDTKPVTLSDGTIIHVRIIGFNHDCNDAGQINPITFECVEILNDDCCMNESCTNIGGWEKSFLRAKLNGSFFHTMLPDDLRSVIKPTVKLTGTGGREPKLAKTLDRLFILSEQEIFGRKIYSMGGEGRWYDWYRQENTEYGKCKQNGERDWRWERSPCGSNTTYFCFVGSDGGANNYYASYSSGVSFGFCV